MSIIICGIGKDGEDYVCPHCGYKSKDIDNFATSMCWLAMGHGDYFHGPAWPQSDAGTYCGRCANAEEFAARIAAPAPTNPEEGP